jgi:hypothetical protein
MADLEQTILENAQGPAEAQNDMGRMKAHNPKDLIEADKYLQQKAAAQSSGLPFRRGKLRAPGAV